MKNRVKEGEREILMDVEKERGRELGRNGERKSSGKGKGRNSPPRRTLLIRIVSTSLSFLLFFVAYNRYQSF